MTTTQSDMIHKYHHSRYTVSAALERMVISEAAKVNPTAHGSKLTVKELEKNMAKTVDQATRQLATNQRAILSPTMICNVCLPLAVSPLMSLKSCTATVVKTAMMSDMPVRSSETEYCEVGPDATDVHPSNQLSNPVAAKMSRIRQMFFEPRRSL